MPADLTAPINGVLTYIYFGENTEFSRGYADDALAAAGVALGAATTATIESVRTKTGVARIGYQVNLLDGTWAPAAVDGGTNYLTVTKTDGLQMAVSSTGGARVFQVASGHSFAGEGAEAFRMGWRCDSITAGGDCSVGCRIAGATPYTFFYRGGDGLIFRLTDAGVVLVLGKVAPYAPGNVVGFDIERNPDGSGYIRVLTAAGEQIVSPKLPAGTIPIGPISWARRQGTATLLSSEASQHPKITFDRIKSVKDFAMGSAAAALGPVNVTGYVAYFDALDKPVTTGGRVDSWAAQMGAHVLRKHSTNKRPDYVEGACDFSAAAATLWRGFDTPQAALIDERVFATPSVNGGPGKWPCTGMTRDDKGFLIVAHDGRTNEADTSFEPRLVIFSPDGSMIIQEIDLLALYPGMQSVQGIVFDASRNAIWVADVASNKIRKVNRAGTAATGDINLTFSPNGLARDAANDTLIISDNANAVLAIRFVSCTDPTGAVTKTFNSAAGKQPDHLFFHDATRRLYITKGDNGEAGLMDIWDADIPEILYNGVPLPMAEAVEGVMIDIAPDGTAYALVTSDGGFHQVAKPPLSMLLKYQLTNVPPAQIKSDTLVIAGVIKRPATQAAITVLVSAYDPITAGTSGGWALAFVNNQDQMRFYARTKGQADTVAVTFPVAAITDGAAFVLVAKRGVGGSVKLYVEGVEVASSGASGDITTLVDGFYLAQYVLGGTRTNGGGGAVARLSNAAISGLGLFTDAAEQAKIEGWQAWRFGRVERLPAGHAHKTAAPVMN